MSTVSIGSNIDAAEEREVPALSLVPDLPADPEPAPAPRRVATNDMAVDELVATLRSEFSAAVADVERRLAQARELEASASGTLAVPRSIHAEDLNIGRPLLDGYLVTANSPSTGWIAWSSLHVVLLGVDYTITNGNTDKKYAWFIKPASGTSATLQTGNALPVLSPVDALIFVNNGGTPISALETSISYAVGPGVIGNSQLASDVQSVLTTLQANDIALQSAIDGSITTYYQNDPPWPAGSPSPSGGNVNQGDVWYDSNDNGAYRWTGTSGSPANSWQKIADTDNSALAGKIDTKVTTYIANNSPGPTAPAGGFTAGDLWMVTDQNNLLKRWSGSAWVSLQLGDAAISGVGGAKVGSGISASNVTAGTLAGALVGTGINGGNITADTVTNTQIGPNAVQPANINAAFHLLY